MARASFACGEKRSEQSQRNEQTGRPYPATLLVVLLGIALLGARQGLIATSMRLGGRE